MRKLIITILMALMVATAAMARPVTKYVYDNGTQGVVLSVETESYGKDFAGINMGELKAHDNYFVWNIYEKQFEAGSAKGMDMWMNTFGDLFKYVDNLVKDGYADASLVLVTYWPNYIFHASITVTNNGYVYGFWEY